MAKTKQMIIYSFINIVCSIYIFYKNIIYWNKTYIYYLKKEQKVESLIFSGATLFSPYMYVSFFIDRVVSLFFRGWNKL